MRFKINEIGVDGVPVNVAVSAEWLAATCPDIDARLAPAGLSLRGSITVTGDDYLLRADLRGDLEATCARCLEPARVHVDLPIVITYVSSGSDEVPEEDEDEVGLVTFTGGELDVSNQVRDELVLAIPFNPLCHEGCKGLCPLCGSNRNVVACTHATTAPATATGSLAALSKIKL
jgi:uncharacterized metal-binding protein YceD (DUF177 family)